MSQETAHYGQPITTEEKLAVTLRYLATRENPNSLIYQHPNHLSTVSRFNSHVCKGIYQVLSPDYVRMPRKNNKRISIRLIHNSSSLYALDMLTGNISV